MRLLLAGILAAIAPLLAVRHERQVEEEEEAAASNIQCCCMVISDGRYNKCRLEESSKYNLVEVLTNDTT
eukprot:CAMPEP_0197625778 /NCGR_PEP_ID=MMETSP1338-20131121/5044_1 /TAXON_ID=43686 ORGANISM="Pelagodinium beii, Strain RCC1491" /NCGR_SAMPLE_ID=MMETSP1338 /ASSEMBLY_ACC=CAM_ASM_000754 /LENGTH=69 /DNA_ID=CAMNT_0043196263 /DNA_START=74 /DNA_END=279 /DNA_ORIENTATION=+